MKFPIWGDLCIYTFLFLILGGCHKKTFKPQSNSPRLPQIVKDILELSRGKWLTDPDSGNEVIHAETQPMSRVSVSTAQAMFSLELNSVSKNTLNLNVLLGETDAPELYQFLDGNLVFKNSQFFDKVSGIEGYEQTRFINVRVAFTIRESDGLEGLRDFHALKKKHKEWNFGKKYLFTLDEIPLRRIEGENAVDPLASLQYFFDRYLYEDFRIIAMRVIVSVERPRYDPHNSEFFKSIIPPRYPEFYKEFHFFAPFNN